MTNYEEIKTKIKGEVETDEKTLAKYSRDASIFEVKPACVVHPKDSEDVRNLVRWVNSKKQYEPDLSITARAAGSDMSGGPLNNSKISKKLN